MWPRPYAASRVWVCRLEGISSVSVSKTRMSLASWAQAGPWATWNSNGWVPDCYFWEMGFGGTFIRENEASTSCMDFAVEREAALPIDRIVIRNAAAWSGKACWTSALRLSDKYACRRSLWFHQTQSGKAMLRLCADYLPMETVPRDKDEFAQLEGKRRKVAQTTLSLDRACGWILNKFKGLDLTLVVFTSDTGGTTEKNASSKQSTERHQGDPCWRRDPSSRHRFMDD